MSLFFLTYSAPSSCLSLLDEVVVIYVVKHISKLLDCSHILIRISLQLPLDLVLRLLQTILKLRHLPRRGVVRVYSVSTINIAVPVLP